MFFKVLSALFAAIWSVICSFFPTFNFQITVNPAVFDCGNEYYSVIWATSAKGSGYIEYTVDGEVKRIYDASSGLIKTDDTIHTVTVPKSELNGNSYKVGSQYVAFKYGYSAIKGKTVESDTYNFKGIPEEDDIKLLSISDIHGMEAQMYQSLSYFTDSPDILILLGDIVSTMETKNDFCTVLKDAADLSKSEIPVVYTRGNHETRGEFASQALRYFSFETGEYYYTFDFGPLSAVVIDSGEDKKDSDPGYDGLVDFNSYREKEYNWLCSLDADEFSDAMYRITFSHMPRLSDHFGKDWTAPLLSLDMDLLVGGHHHKSEFVDGDLPVFIDCGKNTSAVWAASMLTLKDGTIRMLTIDISGNTLLDKTITL
ncbi:MAG: metallophosphoesterase [Clostridia bacterium]|nr:metallophosphoesterase [Clostridia bacterium]